MGGGSCEAGAACGLGDGLHAGEQVADGQGATRSAGMKQKPLGCASAFAAAKRSPSS